jgi:hypothetical protein
MSTDLPTERVRSLIAENNARAALDLAKQTHERLRTSASDALFFDSYLARVDELIERSLWAEADAMLANVHKRWPTASDRTLKPAMRIALGRGRPDAFFVRLCDPSLESNERIRLEAELRERLTDPAILADCTAVPPEHPLKMDAQTLRTAFTTVTTTSPVERDALELPTISHRSPLAPWKFLTQAIACYYRGEDEECRRFLSAIDSRSPPARAVPSLLALVQGAALPSGTPAAQFVEELSGNRAVLQASLQTLDAAFARGNEPAILRAAVTAFERCKRFSPQLAERLCTVLIFRWTNDARKPEAMAEALGRMARTDSYFWRLFALSGEKHDDKVGACTFWERFRLHAVHEGTLTNETLAALYLHMAKLLSSYSQEELDDLRGHSKERIPRIGLYYEDQPAAMRALAKSFEQAESTPLWWLSLEELHARAAAADPRSDIFAAWLSWARKAKGASTLVGTAAQAWHAAFPNDLEPLRILATEAEERGAITKALDYLHRAATLNPLDAKLRQAHVRLQLTTLRDHIKQGNQDLSRLDIDTLRTLPLLAEQDGQLFLAAVEWGWAVYCADRGSAEEASRKILRFLGVCGAYILLEALGNRIFSLKNPRMKPFLPAVSGHEETLAADTARACLLGETFGVEVSLPPAWSKALEKGIAACGTQLSAHSLEALGKQACTQKFLETAYAASGVGMALGGVTTARFLLLRAHSLPSSSPRRRDCLTAAAKLAHHVRDTKTVDAAVELLHNDNPLSFLTAGKELGTISRERAEKILRSELDKKHYSPRVGATRRGRFFGDPSFTNLLDLINEQGAR